MSDKSPAQATEASDEIGQAGQVHGRESADMQAFLGRQLRAVYDDIAKQPVPDRFIELMRQLDSKTGT